MKKLIMFVMVLMLCMGTAAKAADPVAFYCLNDNLEDGAGGYNGTLLWGTEAYSSDLPSSGSGVSSFDADGDTGVTSDVPVCTFDDTPWSITFWFKTTEDSMMIASVGAPGASNGADSALGIWMNETGGITMDIWFTAAVSTETEGLNDDTWHHCAVVYEGADSFTFFIDGLEDGGGDIGYDFDCSYTGAAFSFADATNELQRDDLGASGWIGLLEDVAVYAEALDEGGVAESMDLRCSGPSNPLRVDPNMMLVHETGATIGDFDVSLKFPPRGQGPGNQGDPYIITVTIDPNGGNGGWGEGGPSDRDIVLLAGTDPCTTDNTITLTFDIINWNVPVTILFRAIDDDDPEPPDLIEFTNIGITITSTVGEPNLNGDLESNPWSKNQAAQVNDNDQANILFAVSPTESNNPKNIVTGPVQMWEEVRYDWWDLDTPVIRWRKIWVTVQVPPTGGPVKLQAVVEGEVEGDNLPLTDPCLPYAEIEDPNGMIFTAANYNVPQAIKIWGNDDAVLQVLGEEGEYPTADGDQNYHAVLVVTVIDSGGDTRYQWQEEILDEEGESLVPPEYETVSLERIVDIDIEDNECGAFGILAMDVSNPYYITDPNNWAEDDPDCYVDINDAIGMAIRWLNCSDPQTAGCESYL